MELVRHDIAVGNILYGHAQFITLRLTDQWDIAPGVGRPEVDATHDRCNRKWIATGKAWYVLFHRELGWAMELMLESRVQGKLNPTDDTEQITVNGHPALVRRRQRKRGVLRRKIITCIEVIFNCEVSDRQLRIELSGRCPPEGFQQVMETIPKWWCH